MFGISLETNLSDIKRIASSYQTILKKIGLKTVNDLFWYFPWRYDDFSKTKNISELAENDIATIQGTIKKLSFAKTFKRKLFIVQAHIEDETGIARAVWYNQKYLVTTFKEGLRINISGKVTSEKNSFLFQNPVYEIIRDENQFMAHTARLVPVYPETKGLSSRWIRFQMKQFLPLIEEIKEYLPQEIIDKYSFPFINEAIQQIHFPSSKDEIEKAKSRLGFEEILFIQLFLAQQRANLKKETSPHIPFQEEAVKNFVSSLPFTLTKDQRQATWDIFKDMGKKEPMNRLLNGDVGSGKTVIASLASFLVMQTGWQTALLVPTEVLAWQHFKTFASFFKNQECDIALLTHSQNKRFIGSMNEIIEEKNADIAKAIAKNQIKIIIGTHALLQEHVNFEKLGLLIIDEQHRFGVAQRAKLRNSQKLTPHLLSMTATPIPRTLTLSIYGDLDISFINEMPKGNRTITTRIIQEPEKLSMYSFVQEKISQGNQVFVICPRIEESESKAVEMKTVESEYKMLSEIFPHSKIEKMHGRLKPKEKEIILERMHKKEIDILVSTSVIEVGIDIPNASIIIIENAERFGLAQLHQFRGRIGRKGQESWCFLCTDKEHSVRLKAVEETHNGFELAEKDLAIRGPGEFIGATQWGIPKLTLGSLTDLKLVQSARNEAKEIINTDPELKHLPKFKEKLEGFTKLIHLE